LTHNRRQNHFVLQELLYKAHQLQTSLPQRLVNTLLSIRKLAKLALWNTQ